jgi:hypothetical protein
MSRPDLVVLEEMPDWLRECHRRAGNWGQYPVNGATRRVIERSEAEEIVAEDEDGYACIVIVRRTETMDISAAVESLGATLLTEGVHEGEYAYYDDGMHRYYVVEPEDVELYAAKYLGKPDGYSLWCAATCSEEMPVGWEP